MSQANNKDRALKRLLKLKGSLGLSGSIPDPHRLDDPNDDVHYDEASASPEHLPQSCVVCGYDLGGQVIDRCPECGLRLAKSYKDSTDWFQDDQGLTGWGRTMWQVLTWDRRTRVRTSFVPASAASFRFAAIAIALASAVLGIQGLFISQPSLGALSAGTTAVWAVLITALVGILLLGLQFLLRILLTGRWQKRSFSPASVHYATAWWPVVSMLVATTYFLGVACGVRGTLEFTLINYCVLLMSICLWAAWLADSTQMSGRVTGAWSRLAAIVLLVLLLGQPSLAFLSTVLTQGVPRAMADVRGAVRRMIGAAPVRRPEMHAMIINLTDAEPDDLMLDRLRLLGLHEKRTAYWDRNSAAIDEIVEKFASHLTGLDASDQLVVWLRANRDTFADDALRFRNGILDGRSLVEFLAALPDVDCLVVAELPEAVTFLEPLRTEGNAVIVAPRDSTNHLFQTDVVFLWEALGLSDADSNGNGEVTLSEAYDYVEPLGNKGVKELVDLVLEEVGTGQIDRFVAQLPGGGNGLKKEQRTFVLIADASGGRISDRIRDSLHDLATGQVCVGVLRGPACTHQAWHDAVNEAAQWLSPQDKFIAFIRSQSGRDDDGAIKLANDYLEVGCLNRAFTGFPTSESLIIFGSGVHGLYLDSVTDDLDLIEIAATRPNISTLFLDKFWAALSLPEADRNGNSLVTVEEAVGLASKAIGRQVSTMTTEEDLSPFVRLEVHGKADPDRFFARLPANVARSTVNARTQGFGVGKQWQNLAPDHDAIVDFLMVPDGSD